jgi:ABC-2 type transport system permease protein
MQAGAMGAVRAAAAGRGATPRLYWEVARRGFRRYATYRAATAAGIFTNTVFGFMRAYVLLAMYASVTRVGGFDTADAMTYVFLGQGAIMAVYLWGWWDIALTVRNGAVVTDLTRPLDYQLYWLAQDLGRAVYHAVFRGIPPFLLGMLVFDLRLPHSPITWIAFVVSMTLAVCVSFAMRFMMNLSAFWLMDYRGIGALAQAVWTFFSGFVVPVAFFPGALQTVARALPFAAMMETPVEIFLQKQQGAALAGALAFQAVWAVALLALGRALLAAATRKVVIQGG